MNVLNKEKNAGRFVWMFSEDDYFNGKVDFHFVLDTWTGKVMKQVERRTEYDNEMQEVIFGDKDE